MGEKRREEDSLGLWCDLCWLEGCFRDLGTPRRGGMGGMTERLEAQ